jgi:hypothetical protein
VVRRLYEWSEWASSWGVPVMWTTCMGLIWGCTNLCFKSQDGLGGSPTLSCTEPCMVAEITFTIGKCLGAHTAHTEYSVNINIASRLVHLYWYPRKTDRYFPFLE